MPGRSGAGLGLKPEHYDAALACAADGLWFEVHAENYMVDGGPRLAWLEAIGQRHPLSLHGVGLSLAGDSPPADDHLRGLVALAARLRPALVSEHLAWSTWRGAAFPDLLPVARTSAALRRIVDNVDRTQQALGRPIAIENPSGYLRFDGHDWDELPFLVEIARRSGCRLLLDVNNVHVSANNLGFDATAYIDAVPAALVDEIHLAGHRADAALGEALLVDSHDAPVVEAVWTLYRRLIRRIGPRPTLVERDASLPPFAELLRERDRAQVLLDDAGPERAPPGPGPGQHRAADDRPDGAGQAARAVRGGGRVHEPAPPPAGDRPLPTAVGFHDGFVRALRAEDATLDPAPEVAALVAQPGFAVYRNTVLRGCIDALQANHPTVAALVGEDWFRAAAAVYARAYPPRHASLLRYGEGFGRFLGEFPPAAGLPYLPAVARLDRCWVDSHVAADEEPLERAALAAFDPARLAEVVLRPHASARWAWFDTVPAMTIWARHRDAARQGRDDVGLDDVEWRGDGGLLVRPRERVDWLGIGRAECAFLDACAAGRPLRDAAAAVQSADERADLPALLARLLDAGAFGRAGVPEDHHGGTTR